MKDLTMKKDIKDYIHLYMGCECFEIIGTKRMNKALTVTPEIIRYALTGTSIYKLSVRKLSSMTEEEYAYCGKFGFGASRKEYWLQQFEQFENRPVEGQGKKSGIKNPETKKVKVREGLNLSHYTFAPEAFLYLLSKGFWLFGDDWFDEGLILDKDTVK